MIHILTLNWNGADKISKLANNLSKSKNQDWCWYIKDNGSTDNSHDEIISWENDIHLCLHEIKHNRDNFAKGVNFLFDEAAPKDDDLILFLNNDIEFDNFDNTIDEMTKCLTTDVGIVGSRLLYPNSNVLQHAGVIFGPKYNNLPFHYKWKEINDKQSEKNRSFQAVTAACALMRAKDFKDVGGLSEEFIWAFDDVDLCLKLKYNLNKKIVYCGKTKIYHEESASLNKNPINKMFITKNVNTFKQKWQGKYELDHEKYLANPNYNVIND